MSIERELIDFLNKKYTVSVDENDSLIDSGLIDSIVLLEVVSFVESRAGARVPDDAVTHENFETVARIADLCRRIGAAGSRSTP